jgi:hypothetical protein
LVAAGYLGSLGIANCIMSIARRYAHGSAFPSEAFVQAAIEEHFQQLGFTTDTSGHVDLLCKHPTKTERWHIEAKGETREAGLDFRACVGQLVQRMRDRDTNYTIALPDIPRYLSQIEAMSPWVIELLRIHWLLVAPDRSVRVVPPSRIGGSDA